MDTHPGAFAEGYPIHLPEGDLPPSPEDLWEDDFENEA